MAVLKMALPKGHLWPGVKALMDRAGYGLRLEGERSYVVHSNDPEIHMRIYRAQNIPPLVEEGRCDVGITGHDWVVEHGADVEELLDLGVGMVKLVAAVPRDYGVGYGPEAFRRLVERVKAEGRARLVVASEYENIARRLCDDVLGGFPYKLIRSYGATESFIEVADMIVDVAETGETLRQNGWEVVYEVLESTARLIANRDSLKDPWKRDKIEGLAMLLRAAKEARDMKLLKMNVPSSALSSVISVLPAMKSPTISKLYSGDYAVEVAVKSDEVVRLIPELKRRGATDILEVSLDKVVR
ncbi:ATP phosphoribosyltransferase [Candidatus Geothermarchaeota archaeon ex4572_27]|nr:MAG: ATP phosphoribosyltransferase [Candidatus Geothermarchaeota archaeon ex4572_27]